MATPRISALLVALVLVTATALPAAAQTPAMQVARAHTLAELIAIAEERSPTLAAARQTVAAAEAAVAAARAGFGVTLTARGSASAGTSTATTSNSVSSSASLVASYTLCDNGQTTYAMQQAEANLRSASAALDAARQDVALTVGLAYVAVLSAEQGLALRQQQVVRNQDLVTIAQGQFDAGVVARSDVVRAQAELAAAQSNLIDAQNTVDQDKAALNTAIGMAPTTPIAVASPPAVPQVTVTLTGVPGLIAQRAELRKANSDVEAAEAAVRLARAASGLTVTLEGAITRALAPTTQTAYSVGTSVSFPVFDAGRASAEVARAVANLQQARARSDSARLSATKDAVTALLSLGSAKARLESARAGLAYAEESLRLAHGRYAAGAGAIFEVTDAQTTLLQAEVTLANVQFDQLAGSLQLRWALGRSVVDGVI